MIVLSETYCQSSVPADGQPVADDPENVWLSRGPRFRLPAEQVRDAALAASGLLVRTIGGPSVKPHQPAGLWEDSGTQHTYRQDSGEAPYRRSLYTFWRRTCPPPMLATFDAPTREFCRVRSDETLTPLQGLALLNETGFNEAGRVLAELMVKAHPDPAQQAERVREVYRRLTGHFPLDAQAAALTALIDEGRRYYAAHPEGAGRPPHLHGRSARRSRARSYRSGRHLSHDPRAPRIPVCLQLLILLPQCIVTDSIPSRM